MVRGRGLILTCDKPLICCVLPGKVPKLFLLFGAATGTSMVAMLSL